jgi:hypothetical protein
MAKRSQHVVPSGQRWSVLASGAAKATKTFATQEEAIQSARERARRQGAELYIHGRDGRIRERNSYASDPFTPRG